MSDSSEYHHLELEIALNPADQRHILPPVRPDQLRILDIGCGMGQTLRALRLGMSAEGWGIDVDFEAIALGNRLAAENIHLLVGAGETLPFPNGYFDLVFSRVALPYMVLPTAFSEIARVLRTGGEVWCVLHPPRMLLDRCREKFWKLDLPGLAYCVFIALNSLLLYALGRQMRVMGLCETVQTPGRVWRLMTAVGLRSIPVDRSPFMVVRAIKMQGSPGPAPGRTTSTGDEHRPGDPCG
ncbi:class I SAM-dependent methyltransferase [Methylobacterium planeticum]|uniref:Class I SAM-dependent methyltransferase n=1 Tax=Methylobacterium planeticum TaxID=2615211 RepID=A0A6N6MLV1_9HYPH|nr:class I SAM-dependent methyltransferase [Methylobacterium planeticum]KAB1070757.1 class I SAM-dependent methyltransferase [Methylobacterium planeticum]